MSRWAWAGLGGLLGAGLFVGFLAYRKGRRLAVRAGAMRASFEASGSAAEQAMLAKGQVLQDHLAQHGERLATNLAEATAERVMGTVYGLTPARIAQLDRLQSRFSPD